jgi:RNA polymerase subunit RPABC4/transcription elongation factor Spt4
MKRKLVCMKCNKIVEVDNYHCSDDAQYTCAKCRGITKKK